jgi:hypothetical protein
MKQLYTQSIPFTSILTSYLRRLPQPLRSWLGTFCCVYLILGATGHQAWAQAPQVVTVTPSRNATAAGAGTRVAVTFSQPMQAAAASSAGLRVFSSQRGGLLTGTHSGAGTATATFQPAQNLQAGETVQLSVPKGTLSATGQALSTGSLTQFNVSTTPSAGTFGLPGLALATTPYTYGVTVADFNGDGNLDIASCSQYTSSKIEVRFGRGDGTFGSATDYAMGPSYFLTSADFDNDGDLDLVVGNGGQLVVLRNNGSGVFTALRSFRTGDDVRTIVPADINGDGNLDVVVACASSGAVFVHNGQGDCTFSPSGGSFFSVNVPVGVAVGDVDGDGDLDYVTAGAQSNRAFVRLNDGTGAFTSGATLTVGFQPNGIALGDLNGDGALDVVTANENSSNVSVLLNTNAGTGAFQTATTLNAGSDPTDVKLGDVDGDGDLDLVVGGYSHDVRLNNGSGVFSAGPLISPGAYYVALADVNNDGTLDLVSGSGDSLSGTIRVCLNGATPTLTSFSPASGPIGSSFTLTGTNLAGTTQVTFNGRPAASFTVNSATSVTAVVPAGATSGRIGVTTLPRMSTTSATSFTIPAPVITSLTPTEGLAGTIVTVTGTGFLDATQVTFAGTIAAGFVVNAAGTQLTVAAPVGVSTGAVLVTTPNGVSNGIAFTGAPALSGLSPAFGPAGTVVTLTGAGLLNASAVTFGGVAAPGFTVNAAGTSLSVSAPVGTISGPVYVTTPYGVSNGLTFTGAPVITSFSPASGPAGTRVTVQGLNFVGANQVTFGTATTTTFAVSSATQLSVTVPSGAGSGAIQVRTPAGTAVSTTAYTIPPPVLTALAPASGPAYTNVTITGTDLSDVTGVTFNGVAASYFFANSATSISAYAPTGVTTGPVVVTTPGGPSNGLLFTAAPVLNSFSPTRGSPGTVVTLTGQNLTDASQVSFNGVVAGSFSVVSATQLTATVPVGASTGPIRVTTPGGTGTSNNYFSVTAPALTAITPAAGPAGTVVTLTGSNLLGLTGVTFNGLVAPGATVDATGTQVTVTAPTGVTTGPVVATASAGRSNGLLFSSAPTLTALSPAFGSAGTPVTVTGAGLAGITQVTFNGTVAPGFVVNAAGMQLTVTAPAGVTTGPVVATNAYGSGNGLVFTLPPTISSLSPASSPVGSSVVVTGTDLTGATRVAVGNLVSSFTVNSPTQLTFVVPAGAISGPVRVTTPAGTAISATSLVVPAPVLTTLSPSAGPLGSSVAIAGSGLRDAGWVTFNGTLATGFVVNPAGTLLTVTVPAAATTGPVVVITPNGVSNGLTFTVGPTITSLSPAFGGPGTQVTVAGSNFAGATQVTFNGVVAPGFVVNAAGTSLTVAAPAGVTTGPVVVTAGGTASNSVLYTAAPVITAFTPTSGLIGTNVTIAGTDLDQPTRVLFNGVSATFAAISATQLTALVPVGASTGPVQVVTTHGSGTSTATFTVPAPVLTAVAPAAAPVGGTITLTGTNMQGTTGLAFGGVAAPGFVVNAAGTSLTVAVPAGATGGPLVLTAPHGSSNGLAFAVLPAITGVTPATAAVGTQVTITGTTFGGTTQVSFNGVAATFTFGSATQLTAVVPAGATSGALRVTTAAGPSAAFTYAVSPTVVQLTPTGNSLNVLPTTGVTARFSRAVSTATAGQAGLRLFGSQSLGLLPGTYAGGGTSTVSFTPTQALRAGEAVQATVLTGAAAADGTPVDRPYVTQFTTATGPAPGTFAASSQYLPTTGSTQGVAVGDFDRDGYPDVAASSARTSPTAFLTIYYGDATGSFTRSYSTMIGAATYLTSVDLDNDGDLDLLATKPFGWAEVWRNDGPAGFSFQTVVPTPNSRMTAAADLNGDGNQDLVISCNLGGAYYCLGNGNGTFGPLTSLIIGRILGVAAGDVDGDGDLDIVMANATGNNVAVRLNDGTGNFAASVLIPVANAPSAVALGDVTGDGAPDLLVAQYNYGTTAGQSSMVVLTNNGTGTFTVGTPVAIGGHPLDLKLGDVDGDGDLDAVTVNEASASASVCLNQGQGTFALTTTVPVGSSPTSLVLADLDGNRTLDLVAANATSPASEAAMLVFNRPARYVWTGTVSGDWNTPGNWQSGVVPTTATDAVVPAGLVTYPVLNSGPQAVGKLTVAAGATLTLPATATLRVSGDWENNGTSQLLGSVVFVGSATQLLTGTTSPSFTTLEVDKPAGVLTLQRAATVTSALRLTAGQLLTGPNELTISGATLSETETSYVQGTVVSTAEVQTPGTRYTFGNLGLSLTPSGSGGLPGTTTVRRVTGQRLSLSPDSSIQRYFSIQAATSTGAGVTLETTYWDHELGGLRKGRLGAFSAATVAGPWQPVVSRNDSTVNKFTVSGFTQLNGVWTLGRSAAVLAVQPGAGSPLAVTFRVYPTQLTDDELHYQFTGRLAADATLSIYNALGQQVLSTLTVTSATGHLTLPSLATGLYTVRLLTSGKVCVARFYR